MATLLFGKDLYLYNGININILTYYLNGHWLHCTRFSYNHTRYV